MATNSTSPDTLKNFLRWYSSVGAQPLDQEHFDYWNGDAMLEAIRSYDPDAKYTEIAMGGGDDPAGGYGRRLDFDVNKMPVPKGYKDWGEANYARPEGYGETINPALVYDDDVYGRITDARNQKKDKDPLWTKFAPLVVGALAPMAGAALAGAGIGGGAGLTAAATGSGLTGTGSLPSWLTQQLTKLPQTVGSISQGKWNPTSLISPAGQALGFDPEYIKGGLTLAQLAQMLRSP